MSAADPGSLLEALIGRKTPGVQYLALNAAGPVFEFYGGLADIGAGRAMDAATTLNAYSMSKTVTAAAVLRLVQARALSPDDPLARFFPVECPYDRAITIRQLLAHTAGIPNPIPLRWVHLAERHAGFDEADALRRALRRHPQLAAAPGMKYAYSNIGYWLLGPIIAKVSGTTFENFVRAEVLAPLGIAPHEMSFAIAEPAGHAQGYLEKYSVMNLLKRLLIDRELVGAYAGRWLRLQPHYVDGPAFGGLIGTARAFGMFLQDQMRAASALFDEETRALFYAQQRTRDGRPVPMTLGWHMGQLGKRNYFFKEGGGGGFHCTMRVYRHTEGDAGLATIVMSNATGFNSNACLDRVDPSFL